MTTVAVVDYGAGNVRSVMRALEMAGAEAPIVANNPERLMGADRVILPGVGASGAVMSGLRERGLIEALNEIALKRARPLLGICVGMQIMAERLYEFGEHEGLGWIAGEVRNLADSLPREERVPHMGWNEVAPKGGYQPLLGSKRSEFYFAHSFVLKPANEEVISGTAWCGEDICVAVRTGTAFGVQFHPEKSQINGLRLISEFLEWSP